jgi:transposase
MDHLGIVAGMCDEIGLVEYFDQQDRQWHARVSLGQAIKAMILNGLGFSNRRLYLTPQFFANKPLEALLGPGIAAEDLNDDCLDRALDWLYAHDVTTQFAGLAAQARARWGLVAHEIHVDTTSFAVEGAYEPVAREASDQVIAITYGYSRDHRADLKQWMCALATTVEGDVPMFLRPLDGNSSDKATLVQALLAIHDQLGLAADVPPIYVADSGLYSEANMRQLNTAGVRWVSRVPETLLRAREAVADLDAPWRQGQDEGWEWWTKEVVWPYGRERWLIARSAEGIARATATMHRQAERDEAKWTLYLQQLGKQQFACLADAQTALARTLAKCPAWIQIAAQALPRGSAYTVQASVTVGEDEVLHEALRRAAFIISTNVLDASLFPDAEVLRTYRAQGSVERGFTFLKDPLFLASSTFLKKPERIMALAGIMVLCLLIYRLAEHRVRSQLVATGQTIPDQLHKPTQRPTMRWVFQCFEGLDLLTLPGNPPSLLRAQEVHRRVLALLGSRFVVLYRLSASLNP